MLRSTKVNYKSSPGFFKTTTFKYRSTPGFFRTTFVKSPNPGTLNVRDTPGPRKSTTLFIVPTVKTTAFRKRNTRGLHSASGKFVSSRSFARNKRLSD